MSRPVTVADLAALAKKDYGRIDTDVGPKSKVFSGAISSGLGSAAIGGPAGAVTGAAGAYYGYKAQKDANKLRRKLGGSPENTPSDLKGRFRRNVAGLTHYGVGSFAGAAAGGLAGALATGGRSPGAIVGGGVAGMLAGKVHDYQTGHRKMRDAQIWRRDFANKAEEVETKIETPVEEAPVVKAEPIDPAVALTKALEVYPMGIERSNALTRLSHAVTEILTHKEMIEQLPKEDLAKAADQWARGDDLRKAAWAAFMPE